MRNLVLTIVLCLVAGPAPAAAGSWKLEFDNRQLPSLSYSEDGKLTFVLGCGRAFGLHAKYPDKAGRAGKATLMIGDGRRTMKLVGEFEELSGDDDLTNFVQWDLGFSRQDPDLFGKRWKRVEKHLLDLIEGASPLTISSKTASYQLPRIDAPDWRASIERCGR
ncbi:MULTISPECIES: hypothetical protein [unclassified Bradyrhizobium]|uniref:hypothetical protein n=1 Tax=unclassified Bradyrhizobium TaxID=2631580 RepID=UPI001FF662B3|nr:MULTISPECIES: hypothetical protein [unclassified Bradyrhizobium]MCJ9701394.1 hypothetical protein [Bradyrhizobium sp. SHOUNA76]MCJ9732927.1 hypothetical protein [Bradyrhizobium sp. PRIMUS42]